MPDPAGPATAAQSALRQLAAYCASHGRRTDPRSFVPRWTSDHLRDLHDQALRLAAQCDGLDDLGDDLAPLTIGSRLR